MTKKPFTYEEFKNIYSKVPRLCVDLVIKNPEGVILTLRKLSSWNNLWHFPGSTVLYGEKISEAIQRTAQQELGISVKIEKLLGTIEYLETEEKERGFGWTISLAFLCSPLKSTMRPNEEASEIKVFNVIPDNIIGEQKDFLKIRKILN